MCGIIGYIGNRNASNILIEGLKKLEYRGYDSAGIAVINNGRLAILKDKGEISVLDALLSKANVSGNIGIGHTRWATHGRPSKINAHPHTDCCRKIIVVHNGIIENYNELKADLIKGGCRFKSETDTEVVAHLIKRFYKKNLEDAVRNALRQIKGSYALAVLALDDPDKIVVARYDSPLAIGLGRGENFIVSDISAVLNYTKEVIYLNDNETAVVRKDSVDIFDIRGMKVRNKIEVVDYTVEEVQKGGFKYFMLKEINEQPQVIAKIISNYTTASGGIKIDSFTIKKSFLKGIENINIVACGTAYHAGLAGKYIIEKFSRIPVSVDLGSEFRYRNPIIKGKTLVIAISQSGETADTRAAVSEARKSNVKVVSICNVAGSSLTRESDSTIFTYAGQEISVASTKAYTAQLAVLYLLGLYFADLKGAMSKNHLHRAIKTLRGIPLKQKKVLDSSERVKEIAKRHHNFGAFLYLGRNVNFPTALEGALKLKEISYIPAEGYASGEMKHGPIALIDEYRAVVCIANDSSVFDKMISNVQEILARSGKIVIIATIGNEQVKKYTKDVIFIPDVEEEFSPLLTVIPLQLFAYYIAVLRGYDPDKPRNLAKSVTVE